MITCPSCGSEASEGFKFCPECGGALALQPAHPEERKVVTTLFCDLVGSTALGEDADPEDVDALLRRYGTLARQAVESFGGVVEKFIGDAVVAVFGVPATHEDDAERAVRAGLKIVRAVEDLPPVAGHPVQVRVGINTGEALVRLDVTPGSSENFLTGDAVNAGARLEAAAPPMGVVVGALTHRLTDKSIVYETLTPVVAKGKREPLEAWLAKEPLARSGAGAPEGSTPFVGRSVELSYLTALLDKSADSSSPQVALIVGEPGIGKTRLVAELFAHVDSAARLVRWRQGRCLPFGEGVTFWALAEIVKAHAGILESDDAESVEEKLEAILPSGEDRPWFRQRLRALLGLEAAKAEREENFTAWLRFLEDLAAEQPAVLILEDLHWADEALLDFLEFFALHVSRVPLMIVGTARPELFERHPSFAAAVRINRISLEPLSDDETERLVDSVLDELATDLRSSLAKQAQGNPFYAEEAARLVKDRAGEDGDASVLAGSVQAVIAARLDALRPEVKAVLADAAVVGDVFWDGLLAAISERPTDEMDQALGELVAKQLVHRSRTSSMAGEREYAFGHALAREVAYSQLPRLARAKKHAAIARWTETVATEREDEFSEIVAHHYVTAYELAGAAGDAGMQGSLRDSVVTTLARAGEQLAKLDIVEAEKLLLRAQELAPPDHPALPGMLFALGDARLQAGEFGSAITYLETAVATSDALDDSDHAVLARIQLNQALVYSEGRPRQELVDDALHIAEQHPPSKALVEAIVTWAFWQTQGTQECRPDVTLQGYERAARVSEQLGLPPDPGLMTVTAMLRCALGDVAALEQSREAVRVAAEQGLGPLQAHTLADYSTAVVWLEGPAAGLEPAEVAIDFAERRGLQWDARFLRAGILEQLFLVGRWDEVLDRLPRVAEEVAEAGDVVDAVQLHELHLLLLALRGAKTDLAAVMTQLGRPDHLPWTIPYFDVPMAAAAISLTDRVAALEHLKDWCANSIRPMSVEFAWLIPEGVRVALQAGDRQVAHEVARRCLPNTPFEEAVANTAESQLREAGGEQEAAAAGFAEAAARWHEFDVPYEEAQSLLGQGRCLVALGRAPEAAPVLEQARAIFAKLKAKPALEETKALLTQADAAPST
jgi:class 3 adenylate cyclase/tetratricopeptide (TPR) repeat protein